MFFDFDLLSAAGVRKSTQIHQDAITNNEIKKKQTDMIIKEKKIAESLFINAIAEKETLRLQTIKTIDLLKSQLLKSNMRNEKLEEEIKAATLEHEGVIVSMYLGE